jgi:hypothetical protein
MTDQPIPADPVDGAIADRLVDGLFEEIDRIQVKEPELGARLEAAAREQRFSVARKGGTAVFSFPDEARVIRVEVLVNLGQERSN